MSDTPLSAEQVQRILEERARALARPLEEPRAEGRAAVVVLAVGAERYAVELQQVREVQPLRALCPVPALPRPWAGIVNLRGTLYAVLSLHDFFGVSGESDSARAMLLLVSARGHTLGLLVDEVLEIRDLAPEERLPPLGDAANARDGVVAVTPELLLLLDIGDLLDSPRLRS